MILLLFFIKLIHHVLKRVVHYLLLNLNTNITEGRVLFTGVVDTQEIRIDAVRKVWEITACYFAFKLLKDY